MSDINSEGSSEPEQNSTPPKPRKSDGTFLSQAQINKLAAASTGTDTILKDNNKALMHGTSFTDKTFKGMDAQAVNVFLINYHKRVAKDREGTPDDADEEQAAPNTPILGTPIGSGEPKVHIDQYLTMNPKDYGGRGSLEFNAPSSEVFAQHKNKNEAEKKWLDRL